MLKHPNSRFCSSFSTTKYNITPFDSAMLARSQPPVTSSGYYLNSNNMMDMDSYAAATAAATQNQNLMNIDSRPRMTYLPAGAHTGAHTPAPAFTPEPVMTTAPPPVSSNPTSRIQVKKQRRNTSRNVTPGPQNLSSCGRASTDLGHRTAQACDRCKVRGIYYLTPRYNCHPFILTGLLVSIASQNEVRLRSGLLC